MSYFAHKLLIILITNKTNPNAHLRVWDLVVKYIIGTLIQHNLSVKIRGINESIRKYYIWYFVTKYFTFAFHYGSAFELNILMFCLYTNLFLCCSLMTGFLFCFRCIFVLFNKGLAYPKKNQWMYH